MTKALWVVLIRTGNRVRSFATYETLEEAEAQTVLLERVYAKDSTVKVVEI